MKTLSSKNNPLFKHLSKLISSAKYRMEKKSAVIQGDIIINEISSLLPIKTLVTDQELSIKAEQSYLVSKEILKKISLLPSIQGPIAEVAMPDFVDLSNKKNIAIIDRVTDPGNLGTLIRSALAFGIEGIHITKGSVDPFNDKVIRSSKGGVFKLPISYEPHTSLNLSNFQLLLADMEGKSSNNIKEFLSTATALVLSNETRGLDPKWEGEKVTIQISPNIESLNVGVAGSILFYELAKHSSP